MAQGFASQLSCIHYVEPKILPNFIVLEGADGVGKSTQAQRLEERMKDRGIPCERSAEPSNGLLGKKIRTILQDRSPSSERSKLAKYFAADRGEHVNSIEEKTQNGVYCITERYLFSSLVYQSLDNVCPESLPELWELNRNFPLPEHLFYLDISGDIAKQRIDQREHDGKQREIFEHEDFLQQIRAAYRALISHLKHMDTGMQIHILDEHRSREELHETIWRALQVPNQKRNI